MPYSAQQQFIDLLEQLAKDAHRNSRNHGFWEIHDYIRQLPPKYSGDLETIWRLSRIALFHEEASEVGTGVRKNLPDDHLPDVSMEVAELADIVIRILDYAGAYNMPLGKVILEKMAYNASRPQMHGDKRA